MCEVDINECEGINCQNNGVCLDLVNQYKVKSFNNIFFGDPSYFSVNVNLDTLEANVRSTLMTVKKILARIMLHAMMK